MMVYSPNQAGSYRYVNLAIMTVDLDLTSNISMFITTCIIASIYQNNHIKLY
jgi:hypothetical protein